MLVKTPAQNFYNKSPRPGFVSPERKQSTIKTHTVSKPRKMRGNYCETISTVRGKRGKSFILIGKPFT